MDLESLHRQYRQKDQQRQATEKKIKLLKEKREKLKLAYTRMSGQKAEYRKLRTSVDSIGNSISFWRGTNYDIFRDVYSSVTSENKALHNQIDRILDDMNWKINELDKEIASLQSDLLRLLNGLRDIKTWIVNQTN